MRVFALRSHDVANYGYSFHTSCKSSDCRHACWVSFKSDEILVGFDDLYTRFTYMGGWAWACRQRSDWSCSHLTTWHSIILQNSSVPTEWRKSLTDISKHVQTTSHFNTCSGICEATGLELGPDCIPLWVDRLSIVIFGHYDRAVRNRSTVKHICQYIYIYKYIYMINFISSPGDSHKNLPCFRRAEIN